MLLYLGWIIAAFISGFTLASWLIRRKPQLQRRMTRIPVFRGKTYTEILREVSVNPQTAQLRSNGGILCTWNGQNGYSISLAFDTMDVCQGVVSEKE